jgi:hypothetical protein
MPPRRFPPPWSIEDIGIASVPVSLDRKISPLRNSLP